MLKLKNLLQYKKQIILQGPPGTGKTRLAKEIADGILNENPNDLTPKQLVESFFKSAVTDADYNLKFKQRLEEFETAFPKQQLSSMDLDDYCIGKGNNTNFCWWIEVGLSKFGKFSPGNSGNYVVYYGKSQDDYVLSKFEGSISDVFPQMTNALQQLVQHENIIEAEKYFGYSFIIKILNSYYPEKYFPINGRDSLVNLMKLFGKEFKKVGTVELNQNIQKIFNEYKMKYPSEITNLDFMKFLYSRFDLNNDGNLYDKSTENITSRKPTVIQFHPSYTYEDFVRGIVAESNGKGLEYKNVNKILGRLSNEAVENPFADYVLIIDEINRANLSSVLGELIYSLEYRDEIVNSPYAIKDDDGESTKLILPSNLYIIGTMNTADRSVGHIDYAIRRRFAFVDVLPKELKDDKIIFQRDWFKTVSELFITNYDEYIADEKTPLKKAKTLSEEFRPEDVWIGHSYFIQKKLEDGKHEPEDFTVRVEYEIKPILLEYVKDGVLIGKIGELEVEDYIKSL
ncbi:AAA family ATPase [Chryseobacterium sp. GCR10]|uniref:AAA family ATPase n=2 Tax=Chryseobacterium caseinilyticum TaxID=2771428 RepID=A0ABR8Z6K2_9FLAO|nr:AAA family ATPase [Chryseobacterium caseinilyticum]